MKKLIIVFLALINFLAQANSSLSKESLASRCSELSQAVNLLALGQHKSLCSDKLFIASVQMSAAATLILNDSGDNAKEVLDNALAALLYAELNGCQHYIRISHSKLEAYKLKHLL